MSTKRNAFLMLLNTDMDRAINYIISTQESFLTSGDLFQLAVLELIRKACRGSGQVVCRACFKGDPWDLEAVRERARRRPD